MGTTAVAFAPRRQQAPEAVVGTGAKSPTTSTALWVLGLLTASTAITVAMCMPPRALHENAYFLVAVSCVFFAGVAGIMSAVCMATTTHLRHRQATGRKLVHVVAVGGAFSTTTTALGMLGLAAASTAMNLQSAMCLPKQPPRGLDDDSDYCYHLVIISAVFFAGVAGIMAAVRKREGVKVAK